jgi:hypothetical protein
MWEATVNDETFALVALRDEVERLRAELAAERQSAESYKQSLTDLHKVHCETVAELAAERERKKSYMKGEITEYERAGKAEKRVAKLREALERAYAYRGMIWPVSVIMAVEAVLKETGGGDE